MDERPVQQDVSPRVLNPLWIISLFLGLAEVTVGIAATQAAGWIQGLLAIFSVGFPCAVASAFFLVLWKRPFVLYAPKDYPDQPGLHDYARAVSAVADRSLENVEASIRSAFEQVTAHATEAGGERSSLLDRAVELARDDFRQRAVEVDLSDIHGSLASIPLVVPVTDSTTVRDLLDNVYFAIADFVDAYTYNHRWTLQNTQTGHKYLDIGTGWAKQMRGEDHDGRLLTEAGIEPGTRLRALWLLNNDMLR